jgi:bla regulator protein blaR1
MMNAVAQAALSLSTFPLSVLLKATAILGVAFLILRCTRPAAASVRHLVLAAAFAVLAALPLAERAAPSISIRVDRLATAPILPITRADLAGPNDGAPAAPFSPAGKPERGTAWSKERLLLAAWGLGASVCLVPVLLTPWRLRQLRRSARRWSRAEELLRTIDPTARPVAVFVHEEETAPLACGIARPAILLPAAAAQWSADDLTRALIHEREHVRRADWPVFIATRIVSALYWFHPLVWIAWRRLGLEAERASDDAVLRESERTAYAQQLVTLAKERWRASAIPVLSMAGRSDLSARVAAVLDETQMRGRLGRVRAAVVLAAAGMLLAVVGPLRAQTTQVVPVENAPAFDVVSIRENTSGEAGQTSRRLPGGRMVMNNLPLRTLIISAFGLQPQQLAGGPAWIDSARYDITAQASGEFAATEPGTVGPMNLMMQRMLADRFRLAVHTERRELPIYTLTMARSDRRLGPRIRTAAIDCQAAMNEMMKQAQGSGAPPAPPQRPDGGPGCGMRMAPGSLTAGGTSMAALARLLAVPVGRLVLDRTGLDGGFDFDLEFTADPPAGASPAPSQNPDAPSIFTALDEQLGLKLEAVRAPVEVLVIDRVERPSEN